MSNNPKTFACTVVTVDGQRTTHTFTDDFLAVAVVSAVDEALAGDSPYLTLTNPLVSYNPDHIVRIHWDSFNPEEVANVMQKAGRPLGFRTSN